MPKFYAVAYTSVDGVFPDAVAQHSWQWTTQTYSHYEDALEYYSKVKTGSAWTSKKLKAVYLAEFVMDWEGNHSTTIYEKEAHPPVKTVLYNKHDIEMAPPTVKQLLKAKAGTWVTTHAPNLFANATAGDYFDIPPPEPGHDEEDEDV